MEQKLSARGKKAGVLDSRTASEVTADGIPKSKLASTVADDAIWKSKTGPEVTGDAVLKPRMGMSVTCAVIFWFRNGSGGDRWRRFEITFEVDGDRGCKSETKNGIGSHRGPGFEIQNAISGDRAWRLENKNEALFHRNARLWTSLRCRISEGFDFSFLYTLQSWCGTIDRRP